jgi:hypothetical protein
MDLILWPPQILSLKMGVNVSGYSIAAVFVWSIGSSTTGKLGVMLQFKA